MIVTGLSKSKSRGVYDFYHFYPYKKQMNVPLGTIPRPFVKKEDWTNHKYSLDYQQWLEIYEDIIELIREEMLQGKTWEIGYRLGSVKLVKVKCKSFKNYITGKIRLRNEYGNYKMLPVWLRRTIKLRHKWTWRFKPNREMLREIYRRTDSDYTYITSRFEDK